jgi:CheY-like chemotaxis protein
MEERNQFADRSTIKVLIIEDGLQEATNLRQVLERLGFRQFLVAVEVNRFSNEGALVWTYTPDFDEIKLELLWADFALIFLDDVLRYARGIKGLQLAPTLKQQGIPFIAITGRPFVRKEMIEGGACGYTANKSNFSELLNEMPGLLTKAGF